jgi:carboxyl-terminal processing protease
VLGIKTSFNPTQPDRSPLFVTTVQPQSPAAHAGLRPGDVITAIEGAPLFARGLLNMGIKAILDHASVLTLTLRRPESGRIFVVRLRRSVAPGAAQPPVTARLLSGDLAYVSLAVFVPHASDLVFAAIRRLGRDAHLHGIVLDLRGNGGGDASEPPRLLSAFVHGAAVVTFDDGRGHRTEQRTDDRLPLLHLPLVVLIDGACFSACEATAAAVHDLRLGRLVGERTGGKVAGPAGPWLLADGGLIEMPTTFMRGVDGEIVDGIGVPPDVAAPVTAGALSAGRDPALDQALRLLLRGR